MGSPFSTTGFPMSTISIFLPTFSRNRDGLLTSAISSILAQTYGDFELIVVDDGSTDGSADTIRRFAAQDSRVRHFRFEENVGLPALTCGVAEREATGEFIAWQSDDCEWLPDMLATLMQGFRDDPQMGVVYGRALIAGEEGRVVGRPLDRDRLMIENHIPNIGALVRRDVYRTVGWVDPHVLLKRLNDWDLWVRAARKFEFKHLPVDMVLEKGPGLTDSLGRSVSLNPSVMLKYCATDRDAYLALGNRDNWRPFDLPEGLEITDTERDDYIVLLGEHFERVGKPAELPQHLRPLITAHHPLARLLDDSEGLRAWIHKTAIERLQQRIFDLEALADQRLKLCDERLAWAEIAAERLALCDQRLQIIEGQQKVIQGQDAFMEGLAKAIAAHEQTIEDRVQTIHVREQTIAAREQTIRAHEQTIEAHEQTIEAHEHTIEAHEQSIRSQQEQMERQARALEECMARLTRGPVLDLLFRINRRLRRSLAARRARGEAQ
jgi:glycosyltransferase involved in cell wall biosynthesis